MTPRLKKLAAVLGRQKIDALLVIKDVNVTYLTGFSSSESWLLAGSRRADYLTDFRYLLQAREGLRGTGVRVRRYTRSMIEALFACAAQRKIKRIGINPHELTLAQYRMLQRRCPKGIRLITADNFVEQLRVVKDREEIKQIRAALVLHSQALQYLKRIVRPGRSEREVLFKLEQFVKSKGAGFSFDPIIASGPNGAHPHARVTGRKLRRGESVLIDFGIDVEGYKSDLTRMFFLGKIPALIQQVFEFVEEAQRKAITSIKAGISISEVDFQARNYLKKQRLDQYFGHALGHGVGLEIHEAPRLAQNVSSPLQEGMVITVEPAVYLPGKFGIRCEDMVLVRKNDGEVLSDGIH